MTICPERPRLWRQHPSHYVRWPDLRDLLACHWLFSPVTLGFARLIGFDRSVDPMPYQDFLSTRLLNHTVEVAFALALIVVGLHFAEQARRLFGVRRYRSALIFAFALSDCVPTPSFQRSCQATASPFRYRECSVETGPRSGRLFRELGQSSSGIRHVRNGPDLGRGVL